MGIGITFTNDDRSRSAGFSLQDAGINFIDTADVCSHGESEEIVGKALKDRRDNVVLAASGAVGGCLRRLHGGP